MFAILGDKKYSQLRKRGGFGLRQQCVEKRVSFSAIHLLPVFLEVAPHIIVHYVERFTW